MSATNFTYQASDGLKIAAWRRLPDGMPRAAVQIAHGGADHAGRYAQFAEVLSGAGFAAYANDHRGHGRTGPEDSRLHMQGGWDAAVDDMRRLTNIIREDLPDVPIFLFGHSMGYLLQSDYITNAGDIKGVVFSGSGRPPAAQLVAGLLFLKTMMIFCGKSAPARLFSKSTFGMMNAPFRPARTPFDWISSDEAEVDAYVNDPLCGGVMSVSLCHDILKATLLANRKAMQTPKSLPILILSGGRDSVGRNGRDVQKVCRMFRNAGVQNVEFRIYDNMRHEILNDKKRGLVASDMIEWMKGILAASK